MTDYRPGSPEEIRAELLSTPGALACNILNCQVITQGGQAGRLKHMNAVHGGRYDIPGDRPGPSRK